MPNRFYKIISTIFHPLVVPTISILLYYSILPATNTPNQKMNIITIIFVATYAVPLIILFTLKKLRIIKSYKLNTAKERKQPVLLMIVLFYVLGKMFYKFSATYDLAILFFGTTLSLIINYVFLINNSKPSLHLISLATALGFFLRIQNFYEINIQIIIIFVILLCGLVASSRLHLKAHTPIEIYTGFFIGLGSQLVTYYVLT